MGHTHYFPRFQSQSHCSRVVSVCKIHVSLESRGGIIRDQRRTCLTQSGGKDNAVETGEAQPSPRSEEMTWAYTGENRMGWHLRKELRNLPSTHSAKPRLPQTIPLGIFTQYPLKGGLGKNKGTMNSASQTNLFLAFEVRLWNPHFIYSSLCRFGQRCFRLCSQ